MELSILNLRDPPPARRSGERRRRIRHKPHSPVYASFDDPKGGMALDLSELLDLSEDGFSVQTATRLEVNKIINLSLDLSETKSHLYSTGQVIWSDGSGRAGIRISALSEGSQRILKEWLLVNLLLASARKAARSVPILERPSAATALPPTATLDAGPISDLGRMLSAVEEVRREVRAAGDDFQAVLRLITERALSLTGASGAALAFLTEDKMICRASAGEPALPLGTVVDTRQGLTGECVRTGRMVACADAEIDERVDREICRALGIRSIMAAPIFSDFRVVGLLEVFSPEPEAFSDLHQVVLDRHVELVPKIQVAGTPAPMPVARTEKSLPEKSLPTTHSDAAISSTHDSAWEPERITQEPLKGVPVRLAHILLMALTAAALFLVAGYLSAPKIEKLWLSKPVVTGSADEGQAGGVGASTVVTQATPFDDLRKLAERGDPYAEWVLGTRFHNGEGVPQDDVQAMRWFERAADQGYSDAQATSGAYYWVGRGVPKDLVKAYCWSTLALKQGDSAMESRLEGLNLQMTPAQVATAQAQADEWLRQHRPAK